MLTWLGVVEFELMVESSLKLTSFFRKIFDGFFWSESRGFFHCNNFCNVSSFCCCKFFLLSSPTTLCLEWCCSTPMGSRSRAPLTTRAQCRWSNHLIVVPFQIQFHMFGSVALLYLFKYKCKYNTSTVQVEESSCCCTFSNTITRFDQLIAFAVWRYGDRADWKS